MVIRKTAKLSWRSVRAEISLSPYSFKRAQKKSDFGPRSLTCFVFPSTWLPEALALALRQGQDYLIQRVRKS